MKITGIDNSTSSSSVEATKNSSSVRSFAIFTDADKEYDFSEVNYSDIDLNGDGVITKEELEKYQEKWDQKQTRDAMDAYRGFDFTSNDISDIRINGLPTVVIRNHKTKFMNDLFQQLKSRGLPQDFDELLFNQIASEAFIQACMQMLKNGHHVSRIELYNKAVSIYNDKMYEKLQARSLANGFEKYSAKEVNGVKNLGLSYGTAKSVTECVEISYSLFRQTILQQVTNKQLKSNVDMNIIDVVSYESLAKAANELYGDEKGKFTFYYDKLFNTALKIYNDMIVDVLASRLDLKGYKDYSAENVENFEQLGKVTIKNENEYKVYKEAVINSIVAQHKEKSSHNVDLSLVVNIATQAVNTVFNNAWEKKGEYDMTKLSRLSVFLYNQKIAETLRNRSEVRGMNDYEIKGVESSEETTEFKDINAFKIALRKLLLETIQKQMNDRNSQKEYDKKLVDNIAYYTAIEVANASWTEPGKYNMNEILNKAIYIYNEKMEKMLKELEGTSQKNYDSKALGHMNVSGIIQDWSYSSIASACKKEFVKIAKEQLKNNGNSVDENIAYNALLAAAPKVAEEINITEFDKIFRCNKTELYNVAVALYNQLIIIKYNAERDDANGNYNKYKAEKIKLEGNVLETLDFGADIKQKDFVQKLVKQVRTKHPDTKTSLIENSAIIGFQNAVNAKCGFKNNSQWDIQALYNGAVASYNDSISEVLNKKTSKYANRVAMNLI